MLIPVSDMHALNYGHEKCHQKIMAVPEVMPDNVEWSLSPYA